jgi:hypothetical protein
LGLGLGLWTGRYEGVVGKWLRWYDAGGDWIPTKDERAQTAEVQAQAAEVKAQAAEAQAQAAQASAVAEAEARREAIPRLKALGLGAEQIAEALGLPMVSDRSRSVSIREPEVICEVKHD